MSSMQAIVDEAFTQREFFTVRELCAHLGRDPTQVSLTLKRHPCCYIDHYTRAQGQGPAFIAVWARQAVPADCPHPRDVLT